MDGKRHLTISLIFYTLLSILAKIVNPDAIMGETRYMFFIGFLVIPMGLVPDYDLYSKNMRHRWVVTHSIGIPLVLTLFFYDQVYCWFMLFLWSMHLWSDIHWKKETRIGTYCIWLRKGKRMKGKQSTEWYFWNGALGIFLSLMGIMFWA